MDARVSHITLSLIAAAAVALAGCNEATKTTKIDQPPKPALDEPDEPPSTTLADLAQRDVDAFLNQRREGRQREAEDDAPVGREIVWHQPMSSRSRIERESDITVESPEFEPSPLFMAPDVPEAKPPKAKPETTSGDALKRDRVRELVIELSKELYRDAAHADMPLRELFLIAATTLVSPDRALNPEAIPGLTSRERELLGEFQYFFSKLGTDLDGSRDAEDAIFEAIEALRSGLRNDPELQLGNVALCTRVGGFGDFDPFDKYAFLAHTEQQAVVYIEIAGFTSELNQRGEWVTELSQQLVIYSDRDGIPVWREDWQSAVDVSRVKRRDFFIVQVMTFPKALSVGKYHLKLRLRDEKSGAEAEQSITFEMVADPKMAGRVR